MIFQIALTAGLLVVVIYSYSQRNSSFLVSSFAFLAALIGIYFTWIPSHATLVATAVGVGRGADLIFYLWVVISLVLLLNVHLKLRAQHVQITELVRRMAIMETANPPLAIPPALSPERGDG